VRPTNPGVFLALDLGGLVHVVNARAGEVSRVGVSVLGITTTFRNLRGKSKRVLAVRCFNKSFLLGS
jgi:hypothetical protein